MSDFSHLWNDLPYEERHRLMPHMVESHLRSIEQGERIAIKAHKKYLAEVRELKLTLNRELIKYKGKDQDE